MKRDMRRVFITCLFASVAVAMAARPLAAAEIKPYGRGSFAAVLKAHAGRPLVVHFWSLTCPPCLAELPRLAALQKSEPGFDLVLVATDPIDERQPLSARLDKAQLARNETYAFADAFTDRLYFEADHDWRGELPFTVRIDAHGDKQAMTGPLDANDLHKWLAQPEAAPASN